MMSLCERLDDPDAVGPGRPADVDHAGVEPIEDRAPQHSNAHALKNANEYVRITETIFSNKFLHSHQEFGAN